MCNLLRGGPSAAVGHSHLVASLSLEVWKDFIESYTGRVRREESDPGLGARTERAAKQ